MGLRPPSRCQAEAYDYSLKERTTFLSEHRGRVVQAHLGAYIEEAFGDKPTWSLLDVGGGSGVLCDYLHEQFPQMRATVLDISSDLLEANVRAPWKTLVKGSATEIASRFRPRSFDLVCIHYVLHHIVDGRYRSSGEHVQATLQQARSVLASEGRLSLFEMSYVGWPVERLSGRIIFELTSNPLLGALACKFGANTGGVGVRFLPETAWREMLTRSRFDVQDTVRTEPFRFPFYIRAPLALRVAEPVHFWCRRPD